LTLLFKIYAGIDEFLRPKINTSLQSKDNVYMDFVYMYFIIYSFTETGINSCKRKIKRLQ